MTRPLLLALLVLPAQAAPTPPGAETLPWLPVEGPWIGLRLADDADEHEDELAALLQGGWRLRSAPIWRVPVERLPALRAHPDVQAVWGLPVPAPPPDDADLPPRTPDLTPRQTWRALLRVDQLAWWPGGQGQGVRMADIEYDFDASHEDLTNNPPLVLSGEPLGEFVYHGNACLGLVGGSDDGFGVTGAAPLVELAIVHPIEDDTYDVAAAVERATEALQPGDVLLIEQQTRTVLGLGPVTAEPGTWEAVRAATQAGIHVIEPAGNGSVDLDDPTFADWFGPGNDPGSILVGAGENASLDRAPRSSFGQRVHVFADGRQLVAPSWSDGDTRAFFPDEDPRQAYTERYGGTSGASAIVAGVVAGLSAAARELRDLQVPPLQLRDWIVATGTPQAPSSAAERPIGVRPDAERAVRAWLAW